MAPFSNEVKHHVREKQAGHCLICGRVTCLEIHHKIPENALKPLGIRGKCNEENGVGLCNPNGHGCHDLANKKAINEHLFFKDGKFVELSEIDPNQYEITKRINVDELSGESYETYQVRQQEKRDKRELRRLRKQINIESRKYCFDPKDVNGDVNFRRE